MRMKLVPAPPDALETVETARKAVPLVPGGEVDCCRRIMGRIDVPSRDEARVWLSFLRGLGLVDRGPNGFVRTRADVDLASAFLEGIYGAAEVRGVLEAAAEPLSAAEVVERVSMPAWDRHRYQDPDGVWRDRIADILEWLVLLGEARLTDAGYRRD